MAYTYDSHIVSSDGGPIEKLDDASYNRFWGIKMLKDPPDWDYPGFMSGYHIESWSYEDYLGVGYKYEVDGENDFYFCTAEDSNVVKIDTGLSFEVKIKGYDENNNDYVIFGPYSFTVPQWIYPPENVEVSVEGSVATVSWTKYPDDGGNRYYVYVEKNNGGWEYYTVSFLTGLSKNFTLPDGHYRVKVGSRWYDSSDWCITGFPYPTDYSHYSTRIYGDWVEFNVSSLPSKPTNPTPADTDTEVDFSDYTLSWEDGGGADSYNVYFGDSETPVFLGNQEETSIEIPYTIETDEEGVIHAYVNGTEINWNVPFYWRIDAVNDFGTTTGDVWSFDARPIKVTNPEPEDEGEADKLFPEYSWDASTVATSYDLYVGIGELAGEQSIDVLGLESTSYDSAVVDFQNGYIWGYNSTYHWRVDAANEFGIAEGDEWTFASISYEPPLPTGITLSDVEGEEGEPTGTPTGENNVITIQRLVVAADNKLFYEDE